MIYPITLASAFAARFVRAVLVLPALALFLGSVHAQDSNREKAMQFMKLDGEVHAAFQAKDYDKAIQLCQKQLELLPARPEPHYNIACALARQGKKDEALAVLAKAIEGGYADAAHMRQDDDLESLRKEKQFEELAAKALARFKSDMEKLYDKGADIAGVKTLEGSPEGGLRWRLRMSPTATPEKPNRLIVWLHPSGGSMNKQAEGFAAEFVKRGFALLVPTMKQWLSWSPAEMQTLMNVSIPDAAKTPGIDKRKPILMGYSAGGQGALMMYQENAASLGGLILDAAYPIDPVLQGQGRIALMSLPQGEEKLAPFKKVPLFVLVGAADGGARLWQEADNRWRELGVPLTVTIVPGQGHTWLFGKSETAALYTWLEQVAKGELPRGAGVEYPQAAVDEKVPPLPLAFDAPEKVFGPPQGGWSKNVPKKLTKNVQLEGLRNRNAKYHIWAPDDYTPDKAWPLVLVLHGGPSGRAEDLALAVASQLALGFAQEGAITIYPQALGHRVLEWNYPDECAYLLQTIRHAVRSYHLDPKRIYLTGHSMGGGGVWSLGGVLNDVWAGVAPISGFYPANPRPDMSLLKAMPLYCIQGADDTTIPAKCAELAQKDLEQAGNKDAIFRILKGAGHDVFTSKDCKKELADMAKWLLAKQRAKDADLAAGLKRLEEYGKQFKWHADAGPTGGYKE